MENEPELELTGENTSFEYKDGSIRVTCPGLHTLVLTETFFDSLEIYINSQKSKMLNKLK